MDYVMVFWMVFSLVTFSIGYLVGRKDERKANPPRIVYRVAEVVDE